MTPACHLPWPFQQHLFVYPSTAKIPVRSLIIKSRAYTSSVFFQVPYGYPNNGDHRPIGAVQRTARFGPRHVLRQRATCLGQASSEFGPVATEMDRNPSATTCNGR